MSGACRGVTLACLQSPSGVFWGPFGVFPRHPAMQGRVSAGCLRGCSRFSSRVSLGSLQGHLGVCIGIPLAGLLSLFGISLRCPWNLLGISPGHLRGCSGGVPGACLECLQGVSGDAVGSPPGACLRSLQGVLSYIVRLLWGSTGTHLGSLQGISGDAAGSPLGYPRGLPGLSRGGRQGSRPGRPGEGRVSPVHPVPGCPRGARSPPPPPPARPVRRWPRSPSAGAGRDRSSPE